GRGQPPVGQVGLAPEHLGQLVDGGRSLHDVAPASSSRFRARSAWYSRCPASRARTLASTVSGLFQADVQVRSTSEATAWRTASSWAHTAASSLVRLSVIGSPF